LLVFFKIVQQQNFMEKAYQQRESGSRNRFFILSGYLGSASYKFFNSISALDGYWKNDFRCFLKTNHYFIYYYYYNYYYCFVDVYHQLGSMQQWQQCCRANASHCLLSVIRQHSSIIIGKQKNLIFLEKLLYLNVLFWYLKKKGYHNRLNLRNLMINILMHWKNFYILQLKKENIYYQVCWYMFCVLCFFFINNKKLIFRRVFRSSSKFCNNSLLFWCFSSTLLF
jgi:hypothetical protein